MAHMSVEKIITVGLAIKEAAETARRNKKECRDIERSVARVGALLSMLHESSATAAEAMRHPALSGPLEDLAESVEEALELVAGCRETNALRRFLAAEGMAKKLLRVQDDVLRKMMLGTFATTTLMSITLATTASGRHCSAHLPSALTQDAGQVGISHISHSSTADDRSGVVYDTTTIIATGSQVPYAPSSNHSRAAAEGSRSHFAAVSHDAIAGTSTPQATSLAWLLPLQQLVREALACTQTSLLRFKLFSKNVWPFLMAHYFRR